MSAAGLRRAHCRRAGSAIAFAARIAAGTMTSAYGDGAVEP
jgi:hypothetical protein